MHPGCVRCLETNRATHDVVDDETGRVLIKKGEFAINCDGIPLNSADHLIQITDPGIRQAVGDSTLKDIARLKDPILWAYDNITVPDMETKIRGPWEPRGASDENIEKYGLEPDSAYYQELMVKCTARRKLFRIGRRSGKSWTLIVNVLHKMFTNENYRVLVITPNIAQLDIIFGIAVEFIRTSTTLDSPGIRFVKTPQRYLKLPNGSFMRGFVSGNESIRGQAADMLVIDEGDYLTTDDLSAIVAILSEHKDTILAVSSTPSGAREQFWKWDHNPVFRSFHFPSMVRPNWDENMEIEQRRENPGVKFVHEILAEYGEISQGVFQHDHIDLAIEYGDYRYQDCRYTPGWIYTMGVDWNPVNGTECYVVGVDPGASHQRYKIVDKGTVFREGNTQVLAINEIIRLNRKWNPAAIFVDRGAGSMQIEYLNEFGNQAPPGSADSRLMNIVEAIDFGSKIEMRHLTTGAIQKVYAKPAVVEAAIRRFEAEEILISKFDAGLIRELRGYIVEKIGVNGRPVYGMISDDIEDHSLDAYLLALFAFTMKFSKFGDPEIIPFVRFTGQSGEDTIQGVRVNKQRPQSRSIDGGSEELSIDERLESRNNFYPADDLRHYSGVGVSQEAIDIVRTQMDTGTGGWSSRGGRGGGGRSRAPYKRSNIGRSR